MGSLRVVLNARRDVGAVRRAIAGAVRRVEERKRNDIVKIAFVKTLKEGLLLRISKYGVIFGEVAVDKR